MADQQKTAARDPRYRPFRAVTLGIYLVVTVGFCAHLIISVYRSTYAMTFGQEQAPGKVVSLRECVDGAQTLFSELEAERKTLSEAPAAEGDQRWVDFRISWMKRYHGLQSSCAVEGRSRESLKELFKLLEKTCDLYTTNAVQYAGETGPTVDRIRAAFASLKSDPAMGRLP